MKNDKNQTHIRNKCEEPQETGNWTHLLESSKELNLNEKSNEFVKTPKKYLIPFSELVCSTKYTIMKCLRWKQWYRMTEWLLLLHNLKNGLLLQVKWIS